MSRDYRNRNWGEYRKDYRAKCQQESAFEPVKCKTDYEAEQKRYYEDKQIIHNNGHIGIA